MCFNDRIKRFVMGKAQDLHHMFAIFERRIVALNHTHWIEIQVPRRHHMLHDVKMKFLDAEMASDLRLKAMVKPREEKEI